ncbi:MAG: hypothetical protein HRU09_12075 [Oligoflexales bacterium]|nr:hypothetical protein [Oligoflexales bacterium]
MIKEENFSYYSQLTKRINGEIDYSPIADSKTAKMGEIDKQTMLKILILVGFAAFGYLFLF